MTIDPALLGTVAFALGGLFVEWIHARLHAREAATAQMLGQHQATIRQQQATIQQQAARLCDYEWADTAQGPREASKRDLYGEDGE